MRQSALATHPWTRVLPHLIDTLFLASGIWLALIIQQYPFVDAWLTAKIFGLLSYIALASLALKRARSRALSTGFFIAALLSFGWIVSVARLKSALGFFGLVGI